MSDSRPAFWKRSPAVWPLAGFLLLLAVNLVHGGGFLNITTIHGHFSGNLIDIFNDGAPCLVLALGMTLVIATGGIDLSVGSVMAFVGGAAATMLSRGQDSLVLVLAASLGLALVCGLVNGVLISWVRIQPIVATLTLMVAGRGLAQLVTDGNVVIIKHEGFSFIGNGFVLGLPFAPVMVTMVYLLAWAWLRRTAMGLFFEATGDNETAGHFAGLGTARIKCLAYVACGLCAGVAGLLRASNISAADPYRMGENMELDAIFSVVVGGTALSGGRFTLLGSYIGAVMLQTLTVTMYNVGVPPAVAPVPKALLIITVCLLQSETTRRWFGRRFQRRAAA